MALCRDFVESRPLGGICPRAPLALELIIKAVIALRLENGEDLGSVTKVPANHMIPELWSQARLPQLSRDDYGRLIKARIYLRWAGRYPAPAAMDWTPQKPA